MNRKILGLAGMLGLGMAGFAGLSAALVSLPAAAQSAPAQSAAPATTADKLADRVLGDPKAAVTILDYSSMTCPHCAHFHTDILPKIKEKYIDTGKVKLVFRDFPFDQAALRASQLARCAPAERYFPLLDVLFKSQPQWSRAADPTKALAQYGKLAGMGQDTIDSCFADNALADGILGIRMTGDKQFKVEATPTFILNDGKARIEGAQSFETFAAAIDKLLK